MDSKQVVLSLWPPSSSSTVNRPRLDRTEEGAGDEPSAPAATGLSDVHASSAAQAGAHSPAAQAPPWQGQHGVGRLHKEFRSLCRQVQAGHCKPLQDIELVRAQHALSRLSHGVTAERLTVSWHVCAVAAAQRRPVQVAPEAARL